jgi:hypothetical protein
VEQGSLSSTIGINFTIAGSQIPAALPVGFKGDINSPGPNDPTNPTLQMPTFDGDVIFLYTNNAVSSGYGDSPVYFFGQGWQSGISTTNGPVINPGQGFWMARGPGFEDADVHGNPSSSTANGVQSWAYSFTVQ